MPINGDYNTRLSEAEDYITVETLKAGNPARDDNFYTISRNEIHSKFGRDITDEDIRESVFQRPEVYSADWQGSELRIVPEDYYLERYHVRAAENVTPKTEKLYSPLNFYLRDNDMLEHYDGDYWRDDISHYEASEFLDAIDLFLRRDRDTLDKTRGMMEYYGSGSVDDKVYSLFPTTEFHEGKLWCVAELTLTAPLTTEEMAELKDWWSGQLSDGWGEGIEQHEIKVERGELYMEPWTSDDSFFVDTREQFSQRLGVKISSHLTIEPAAPLKAAALIPGDGEKPSVLEQIRQAAKDAKTRPPSEKAAASKKHKPEL